MKVNLMRVIDKPLLDAVCLYVRHPLKVINWHKRKMLARRIPKTPEAGLCPFGSPYPMIRVHPSNSHTAQGANTLSKVQGDPRNNYGLFAGLNGSTVRQGRGQRKAEFYGHMHSSIGSSPPAAVR
ncbi:hypothetical protein [uncultured Sulfitobacter sp.]|uniref:hypothetical protein n=1 Tax=uncultured Sulfitobacter sp. TaxID=191468 RepID=UPI00261AF210|nr:hypothetical protein [uncultured Sulfitobacter sp.]